jgi:hypothetical protein
LIVYTGQINNQLVKKKLPFLKSQNPLTAQQDDQRDERQCQKGSAQTVVVVVVFFMIFHICLAPPVDLPGGEQARQDQVQREDHGEDGGWKKDRKMTKWCMEFVKIVNLLISVKNVKKRKKPLTYHWHAEGAQPPIPFRVQLLAILVDPFPAQKSGHPAHGSKEKKAVKKKKLKMRNEWVNEFGENATKY